MSIKLEPAMKRLNEISVLMNNDDLPLEEAVKLYSEANELITVCKADMKDAQLVLKELFMGE
ncbi:MAG: exodeoxyribonuclease VII small subunit [Oscillospiraceae bacterium]|nr:exodeoxyribonuclease VII small subunit [Oscillospiraceae bacterium]